MRLQFEDQQFLFDRVAQARAPLPPHWLEWYLEGVEQALGVLSVERVELLKQWWPENAPMVYENHRLVWRAGHMQAHERSQLIQSVAEKLQASGHITGWRNEHYDCWSKGQVSWPDPPRPLFQLERAAYRFFGLRSHASHVHGMTLDGQMWCGRRSSHKATDPNLLDNMAAGGLPAGEVPHVCALREIHEEAGLFRHASQLVSYGAVTTEREVPEGWHSETIFVYGTTLAKHETPRNLDGEVSEFMCLDISEVLERMRNGEFTHDAACAIALYLLNQEHRS